MLRVDKYKNTYRIASARLQNWDYAWNGLYFISICTQNREYFFGEISDGIMVLSEIGELAKIYWLEIPYHFPFVQLDAFVVMPNHIHGIIVIDKPEENIKRTDGRNVETLHATSLRSTQSTSPPPLFDANEHMASISPKPGSLSTIIRSYKSVVSKTARKINTEFSWQSRFYDHIIRNDKSYKNISEYITNNPLKWQDDKFNPDKKEGEEW